MRSILWVVGFIGLAACGAGGASGAAAEAGQKAQPAASAPASLSEVSMTAIDGAPFGADKLAGKVVLFVNVASKCGYTQQYEALQAVYDRFHAQGLEIVGVPCNQFAGQEPGSPEEIVTFCRQNYGVTFPLLEKQDVNGSGRSPLYRWLVASEAGGGSDIGWNFEKFLVARDGRVLGRFTSKVKPDDPQLVGAIERALAATAAPAQP
jgi:glutathione peroxidase-family protein